MEKKTIKLTESMLQQMIAESIQETMQDEGFIDKLKAGWNTAKSQSNTTLGQRIKNGYQNYKAQGEFEDARDLAKALRAYIRKYNIPDTATISQVLSHIIGKSGRVKKDMYKTGLPKPNQNTDAIA